MVMRVWCLVQRGRVYRGGVGTPCLQLQLENAPLAEVAGTSSLGLLLSEPHWPGAVVS